MEHNLQYVFLKAFAVTHLTLEHKIRHKLHLYGYHSCTFTLFASSSLGIEREILCRESHLFSQRLVSIKLSYGIVSFYIGGGV